MTFNTPKERPTVIDITAGRTKHNTVAIVGEAEAEDKRFTRLAVRADKMGHKLARVNAGFVLKCGMHSCRFNDLDEAEALVTRMARGRA